MPHPFWPLFDLVIRTPRIEIRLPTDAELIQLAQVASSGIHDPNVMPFAVPWTDAGSPQMERSALQWWWRQRAEWQPENWTFTGCVFVDRVPVGVQDLGARNFTQLRSVLTGSWLGLRHQGNGLGYEMRSAMVHLAFEGLGAVEALSGAWHDNAASLGVSRKLGYEENGAEMRLRRQAADTQVGLRLTREVWSVNRRSDIEITGLAECLELFGVSSTSR